MQTAGYRGARAEEADNRVGEISPISRVTPRHARMFPRREAADTWATRARYIVRYVQTAGELRDVFARYPRPRSVTRGEYNPVRDAQGATNLFAGGFSVDVNIAVEARTCCADGYYFFALTRRVNSTVFSRAHARLFPMRLRSGSE